MTTMSQVGTVGCVHEHTTIKQQILTARMVAPCHTCSHSIRAHRCHRCCRAMELSIAHGYVEGCATHSLVRRLYCSNTRTIGVLHSCRCIGGRLHRGAQAFRSDAHHCQPLWPVLHGREATCWRAQHCKGITKKIVLVVLLVRPCHPPACTRRTRSKARVSRLAHPLSATRVCLYPAAVSSLPHGTRC